MRVATFALTLTALMTVVPCRPSDGQQVARDPSVTDQGRGTTALVEEYLKDAEGRALPGENSWPLLLEVIAATSDSLPPDSTETDSVPLDHQVLFRPAVAEHWRTLGKDTDAMRAKAKASLETMAERGVFDKLSKLAAQHRFIRPPQPGHLIDWELPEIGTGRLLTRASGARMNLAAEAGHWAVAVQAFEQTMALGRVFSHQCILIEYLSGVAMQSYAEAELRRLLLTHAIPAGDLREFLAAIDRQSPLGPVSLPMEGERLVGMDTVAMVYDDPAKRPFQVLAEFADRKVGRDRAAAADRVIADREETVEGLTGIYDRAAALSKHPGRKAIVEAQALAAAVHALPPRQLLAGFIIPALDHAVEARVQAEAALGGTRLMVAIELFHAERGVYPNQLSELVPGFLPAIPADPYSSDGFRYKRITPGDDPAGLNRAYLLYSPGFDGTDNGGKVSPWGSEAAANPAIQAGFDFVFNLPPR
jgi:hypothetical protein